MGFSRDERPWVGPVPTKPGVFVSAGYTGHGMPNTWLCGKAAAVMVRLSDDHSDEARLATAVDATGLPEAYKLTEKRMKVALEVEDVEAKDWAELNRGTAGRAQHS